jgi:ABC-2 type transport system permease protein
METALPAFKSTISLSRSTFAAELRALGAVVKRDWLHFIRYPTWIISLLVWPVLFPAAYVLSARALAGPDGSGLQRFLATAGTDNFLGFIIVGTTTWMWLNTTLWNVGLALRSEQRHGTMEANWLTPTWRFSFLLGTSPTQLFMMVVFMAMTFLEFTLFFGMRLNGSLGYFLLVLLAAGPCIYGIAFVFASLVMAAREANSFVFLVRGIVMIFCGITYPLSVMPGWMQSVAAWLPPTIIIRAAREALLNGARPELLIPDLERLLVFGIFWLVLGYIIFNVVERRARRLGTLNQF